MERITKPGWTVLCLLVGCLISTEIRGVLGQSDGEDGFSDDFRLACILLLVLVVALIAAIILCRFYCANYCHHSPYKKVKTVPEDPEDPTELEEIANSSTDESIVKQPLYDYTPITETSMPSPTPVAVIRPPRYSHVDSLPKYSTLDPVTHAKESAPSKPLSPVEEPAEVPLPATEETNSAKNSSNGSPPPPYDTGSNPVSDHSPLSSPTHSAEILSTGLGDDLSEAETPSRQDDLSSNSDNLAVDDRLNATPSPPPLEEEHVQHSPEPLDQPPTETQPLHETSPSRDDLPPVVIPAPITVEDEEPSPEEVHQPRHVAPVSEETDPPPSDEALPVVEEHQPDESDHETPDDDLPHDTDQPTENLDEPPVEDTETPVYVGPARQNSSPSTTSSEEPADLLTPSANEIPPSYEDLTPVDDPICMSTPAVDPDNEEPSLVAQPPPLMRPESYEPRTVDEPDCTPGDDVVYDDADLLLLNQPADSDGFDEADGAPARDADLPEHAGDLPDGAEEEEDTIDGAVGENPDSDDEPDDVIHSIPLEAVVTIENPPVMDESTESMDFNNYSNATTIPRDRHFY